MATAGVKPGHEIATPSWNTYSRVIDELDAPRLVTLDAINAGALRTASGASGLDRIVGMMTATRPHDTMPSNGGRGATMGPPGCPLQSPPVPFRRRRRIGLQGFYASWGDWRGQKSFLIRKRFPGSSPGSPTPRKSLHNQGFREGGQGVERDRPGRK
jgi:hypothetical protein